MSKWWDEPYTAEELAARPKRRSWDEVFEEYAQRTGQQVIPVRRLYPSATAPARQRALEPQTVRIIQRAWAEGASAENIHRAFRLKGESVSLTTIYDLTRHIARNAS